ncbi:hypothetical protein NUW54_g6352 [Trametes sanguinea]|uniref:Uncharacterized protein n=1 Tax=Trametes sanguinea TaxID=158606 RepID=A0ACC1PSK3_9APHY|nr:hypothetical protein NUW54_g6352 [Trametes sanguinea]
MRGRTPDVYGWRHTRQHGGGRRTLKRKAKEQVAGGLGDIKAAISALEEDIPVAVQNSVAAATEADASKPAKPKPKPGQIGEGKGAPLNKNQRKKALYVTLPSAAPAHFRVAMKCTCSRRAL